MTYPNVTIKFKDKPLGWIELKNNQLSVEEVPEIDEYEVPLYLVIKNIPGGTSKVKEIDLFVHSLKNTRTAS